MPTYRQMSRRGHSGTPGVEVPTAKQALAKLAAYRRPIIVGGTACALILALWGGLHFYHGYINDQATQAYARLPAEKGQTRSEALAEIAQRYPKTGAGIRARFQLGQGAFQNKNFEEAVRAYLPLTKLPDGKAMIRTMARHNLGATYEAMGEWSKALELYRAASLDPANVTKPYSYYDLARAYQALDQMEEARRWYEKAAAEGIDLGVGDKAKERLKWLDTKEEK